MLSLPPLSMGKGNVFVVGNLLYDAAWKQIANEKSGLFQGE